MSAPEPRLTPYGDIGVLIELEHPDSVLALADAIKAARLPGVLDVVPAARTVLVRLDRQRTDVAAATRALRLIDPVAGDRPERAPVEVPVVYDGPDLEEVGRLTGLGADGVVDAHAGSSWTVAFCGFAPGFAYCAGGDPRLTVPRRDDPRTRVPAGAVGLAGEFTGVYPGESPGGWQLIGRTDAVLWALDRDPPALLRPGVRVQFVAVAADAVDAAAADAADAADAAAGAGDRGDDPPRAVP